MTDHLIDTVARAIYDLGRYEGAFDHDLRVIDREPRVEAAVWKARARARAALAAMPRPNGYAVRHQSGFLYDCSDVEDAQLCASRARDDGRRATVVALVPVEDQ